MSRLSLLWAREIGDCRPLSLQRAEESQRVYDYQLSEECQIESVHTGGVNSLHLDAIENRYLLSGSSDKLITITDTWNCSETSRHIAKQIAVIGRPQHSRFCHKYSIACVQWYHHDNAIFTTSSTDKTLKIWDANALRPAETFRFKFIIQNHAMSPMATSHNLIAVATADSSVYLADMRTGSHSHILQGHRGAVLSVKWSLKNQHQVASGSDDNKILLWDVRQARGHLLSFDQHNGRDKRGLKSVGSAHGGHVNGLCFTNDGLFLLSTGTDNKLALWNADTGENTLTNYGRVPNSSRRTIQIAVDTASNTTFVPSDRPVMMFNVHDGSLLKKLSSHFSNPTCCEFNPRTQEMYSGGQDNNILVWGPPEPTPGDEPGDGRGANPTPTASRTQAIDLTADAWSDDSDGG